jgi:hypothetical protein
MQGLVLPLLSRSFGSFMGLMSFFVMLGLLVILIQQYGWELPSATQTFMKKKIRRVKTFSQDQENTVGDSLPTDERGPRNEDRSRAYFPT